MIVVLFFHFCQQFYYGLRYGGEGIALDLITVHNIKPGCYTYYFFSIAPSDSNTFLYEPHIYNLQLVMRLRYWRLAAEDILEATYPPEKVNHWEIKCMQGEYQHFGVFWFRYGTPFDKEPVHGICFYYNEIPEVSIQKLLNFLESKFGGTPIRRKTRVFLKGSQEFSDPKSIAILAKEMGTKFNAPTEITIEFEKVTQQEQEQNAFNMPPKKSLPIVGTD